MNQNKLINKIVIIFICILFFYSSIGTVLIFQQIKLYHKKSIRSQILNRNIPQLVVKLSFSKQDIDNHKIHFIEEHEFRFEGKLFDIIEKFETSDSIHFLCINDTEEEKLETQFLAYVINEKNPLKIPLPVREILKLLNIDLYYQNNSLTQELFYFHKNWFDFTSKLIDSFISIPDPPPKILINTT